MRSVLQQKRLDSRARYVARRAGLRACKSRRHVGSIDNLGGYCLSDLDSGFVVDGSRYDMGAEKVIEYCAAVEGAQQERGAWKCAPSLCTFLRLLTAESGRGASHDGGSYLTHAERFSSAF